MTVCYDCMAATSGRCWRHPYYLIAFSSKQDQTTVSDAVAVCDEAPVVPQGDQ